MILKVFYKEIIASLVLSLIFVEEFFCYFILRLIMSVLCYINPNFWDATLAIGILYIFSLGLVTVIVVTLTIINILSFNRKESTGKAQK